MSKGIRKGIVANNPKLRMMAFNVDGTSGTPAASGLDASQILSVVDNGAGDYTINFKYPFNPNSTPIAVVSSLTVGVACRVTAIAYNTVTVEAPADADFSIMILGNDGRLTY